MKEIKLDASTIRNEIQEKLKNLKKFQQSEEYAELKKQCDEEAETIEEVIESMLRERESKTEKHECVFSELDFMIRGRRFLESMKERATNEAFLKEVSEQLVNIKSHLFLQSGDFDYPRYSALDAVKHDYKLNLGFEQSVKQMITRYELQEKEVDVDGMVNAYAAPSKPLGEIEV